MMRKFFVGVCCLWLTGPCLPTAQAQPQAQDVGPKTTVVRKGEDCQGIVRRVYGNAPGAMARFHAANRQLGGLPHVLKEGDVVSIPPLPHAELATAEPEKRPSRKAPAQQRQKQKAEPKTQRTTSRTTKTTLEPPRLTYVGPAVRTQTRREGWTEALPDQPIDRRMRIKTSAAGGAEMNLQDQTRLQLSPNATMVIDNLPRRRTGGEVDLLDGTLRAGTEMRGDRGPLLVHTPSADVKVRGGARIDAEGKERAMVAVYDGSTAVRAHGSEVKVPAGQGTLVRSGQKPVAPRALPQVPSWEGPGAGIAAPSPAPILVMALGALSDSAASLHGEVLLGFRPVPRAEQYLVEVARDPRFNDRRGGGEIVAPPLRTSLPPGSYLARISAVDTDRLVGPPSTVRPVHVITLRSDAALLAWDKDDAGQLRPVLHGKLSATLIIGGGGGAAGTSQAVMASVDDGPPLDCGNERTIPLGPGEHRVVISVADAHSEALVSVAAPVWPPQRAKVARVVEPPDLPVPLSTPGFPSRALHPRSRAYALIGVGSALGQSADTYRLDVGGELALLGNRISVDANLPVLYRDAGPRSGLALGDLALGFRALAYRSLHNRFAVGPLLRLQLPTGVPRSLLDPTAAGPDRHPVVLDPAVGATLSFARIGLLTTQGPTAVLAADSSALRWSMTYVAEARLLWISLLAELDGSLGIVADSRGDSRHGAALGGGVRIRLSRWHLLLGARGGLGQGGQDLFGRYYLSLGTEWVY